jgi:hypothetical protein
MKCGSSARRRPRMTPPLSLQRYCMRCAACVTAYCAASMLITKLAITITGMDVLVPDNKMNRLQTCRCWLRKVHCSVVMACSCFVVGMPGACPVMRVFKKAVHCHCQLGGSAWYGVHLLQVVARQATLCACCGLLCCIPCLFYCLTYYLTSV